MVTASLLSSHRSMHKPAKIKKVIPFLVVIMVVVFILREMNLGTSQVKPLD